MAKRVKSDRFAEMHQVQQSALAHVRTWLETNAVVPNDVLVDEHQFAAIMNTVTRGLVQAYVAGYTKAAGIQ